MAYTNLPLNLQDIVYSITDRVTKLETGPNSAQTSADSAYTLANTANTNAASASATAVAAQTTANGAQTSANGKNVVTYSSSTASGSGTRTGDVWFQFDGSNNIQNQWVWNGSSWQISPITSAVISQLDAGKITTGTLNATLVTVTTSTTATNSITFSGTNTSIDFKTGGSTTAHIVPYNSGGGLILHYGASADPGLGSYPYVVVGSGSLNFMVSSTVGITVSSTAITLSGQATVGGNLAVNTMSSGAYTAVVWNSSNGRFYTSSSTRRVKDNITPLVSSDYLSAVLSLEPVTFNYKPEFSDDQRIISGLIAEDVYLINEFKNTVNLDKNGLPESIAYDRLAMFFIPAIKQLNDRLTQLEGK